MARPTVSILFNISALDQVCTNPLGDDCFLLLGTGDSISWRDSQQMSGDDLNYAAYPTVIPESGEAEAPKLFVLDNSESMYQQVILAGTNQGNSGGNYRYVCAAYFSGPTLTVPYLEAYDDNTHETWENLPLGDGVAANSIIRAICTTDGSPGSDNWSGTPIAGTASRIALSTIPIGSAGYVYWNMKMMLSDAMLLWDEGQWMNTSMVLTIHFTYS